jgi:predicted nucleotidyltransferase
MQERILEELQRLESEQDVRIVYACESGSRAWGFASPDSDYDVRFIYVRRPDWYLSVDVEYRRDVIERPISEFLDIGGWDVRKAMQLLRKSNPPLLEWLQSPIVYFERCNARQQFLSLLPDYFSPISCAYHYWRMASNNHRAYLQGESIRLKKYFYVLRPLLAVQWIESERGPVPTEFGILLDALIPDGPLRADIDGLLEKKQSAGEMESGPRVPILHDFLDSELARLGDGVFQFGSSKATAEALNVTFRNLLDRAWRDA